MNEFVASNGTTVRSNKNGVYATTADLDSVRIYPNAAQALREFFLAERDAELGRWRSKEHPEYVVYLIDGGRECQVVAEQTGNVSHFGRGLSQCFSGTAKELAREFFAAHPEPKPWHDAQQGEVWALTIHLMGEQPCQVVRTEESGFRFFLIADQEGFRPGLFPNEEQIIAGRRIWPEVQ